MYTIPYTLYYVNQNLRECGHKVSYSWIKPPVLWIDALRGLGRGVLPLGSTSCAALRPQACADRVSFQGELLLRGLHLLSCP
jgi:hypothetical protein